MIKNIGANCGHYGDRRPDYKQYRGLVSYIKDTVQFRSEGTSSHSEDTKCNYSYGVSN